MQAIRHLPLASFFVSLATTPGLSAKELRPLSTDRPDTTESAYSVDAGHFQFESELASWSRDGDEREFTLGEVNAKYGLTSSTDLQFVLPFYTHVRNGSEGFGDMEIRLKHNLWGNDGGDTALAVMPYLKLPTANGDLGNDEVEGGIIMPFAFDGPAGWSCAVMGEVDLFADEDSGGYQPSFLATATAGHDLTECTAAFVELVGILSAESSDEHEAYFNCGMTWAVTPTWQVDGGIRVGLNDAATGFTPFLGLSTKF